MTEIIVVGAGISAAAACAVLKKKFKVTVFEQRSHIGGNCYDRLTEGTYVHQYGAHIYHNPNKELHQWTKKFTDWVPYQHSVTAEILDDIELKQVPFPYSEDTEKALRRSLSDQEIVDMFFKGYSTKMWGQAWGSLPDSIKNRVPKRQVKSDFFPNQITALPARGYTTFIENMLDGCTVITNADLLEWTVYASTARAVIYCGRLDRLVTPKGTHLGSEIVDFQGLVPAWLNHVGMTFDWGVGEPKAPTGVLNYCHTGHQAVRRVQHAQITGGSSPIFHVEYPDHRNDRGDPAPAYPAPRTKHTEKVLEYLKMRALQLYPNLHPLGRLASHLYTDMHQAIGSGRALGLSLLEKAL